MGILRLLGDGVDDPIDRIGAPNACPGATDNLNAFDVFQCQILGLLVDAGKGRGINHPAVDQHQQLVGKAPVEATGRDRPLIRVDPEQLVPPEPCAVPREYSSPQSAADRLG